MNNTIYKKINIACFMLLAFFIPVNAKVLPFIILITGLNWLIMQNFDEKFLYLKKNLKPLLFLSSVFMLYILSILYSENKAAGWFDIQVKLSLLLFPFFLFTAPPLQKHQTAYVFYAFVAGCIATVLISFLHAFKVYFETSSITAFVYTNFSFQFHPTYFALYLNMAVVILFHFLITENSKSRLETTLKIMLIIVFSVSIVLANSKAVIFTLLLTLLASTIYLGNKKGFLKTSLLLTLGFVFLVSLFVYKTPALYNRISDSRRIVNNFFKHEKLKDYEGTSQRILVWRSSTDIIKNNFFIGVGAGDVKDELMKNYAENNYKYILAKKLNPHNQFLQTFVATGIAGIVSLLLLFAIPLYKGIRLRHFVYVNFLIIVFINFLTESMLEKQAGVVFFAFFNSLLFVHIQSNKSEVTKNNS